MPGWMMLMGGNIVDIPSALTGLGGFGMLLGPEGTSSPPPSGGGFLCLLRRVQTSHSYQLLFVGFGRWCTGCSVSSDMGLWVGGCL